MIEELFTVATEFRFDVGQAIFNTNALGSAVDDLSHSADAAGSSLNYLATGLIAKLGLGSGGLLSILAQAVRLNEDFDLGSIGFVNSISSNFNALTGHIDGFNEQLEASNFLMERVGDQADALGLSGKQMAQIAQLYSTPLAQNHKLGTNFSGAISLAKNTMIGAESMGLGGNFLAEQIAHAISPGGTFGGKAFERLVNTQSFRSAGIMHPQQFSGMMPEKKMDLIIKAMTELGENAGYLAARLNMMTVQIGLLKANVEKVLKPIGDALVIPLKLMLKQANAWLLENGAKLGETIGTILSEFLADPEKLYINIKQMRSFGKDMKNSMAWSSNLLTISWLLGILGGKVRMFAGIASKFQSFFGAAVGVDVFGILAEKGSLVYKVFKILGASMADLGLLIGNFLAIGYFVEIIRRASIKASVEDAKDWVKIMPDIAASFLKLKHNISLVLLPLTMSIGFWSDLIYPLFKTSFWANVLLTTLNALGTSLGWLGWIVQHTLAVISGAMSLIMAETIFAKPTDRDSFKKFGADFMSGYNDFMTRYSGDKTKQNSDPHIKNEIKVDARFDMREQMEPDRIAFAVTSHLKKAIINKAQASNMSLYGGLNNLWGDPT